MRNQRKNLRRALLLQKLSGPRNRVRCISQIIDEDSGAVRNISHQHHSRVLAVVDLRGTALFVDEGEGHAEGVCDRGCALGAAGVGGHDDSLLVVRDVELDVFAEEVAAVEVVDGDIEEALVLGVYKGNYQRKSLFRVL
jgi:hypothetical protein